MTTAFGFKALPWNIVFAPGAIQRLAGELDTLGFSRALVLSTPEQAEHAEMVSNLLQNKAVGQFTKAVMHVPVNTVEQAIAATKDCNADCSVAIGGGSTTGLGKALALKLRLPNIVIPTTYAGSEMTNVWGMTADGAKQTGRDDIVVPNLTLYDPELTLGLPAHISGPSGINAMAQAVVNVTANTPNPIISALALDGIRALASGLPKLMTRPNDIDARSETLYGACLCGGALGLGVTGLHHRICHTLGGAHNTSHADTHAIILAHTVAFNASAVPSATAQVAAALGVADAARGIYDLLHQVSKKTTLADLGIIENDLDRIAQLTVEKEIPNPKPVTAAAVRQILDDAFFDRPPRRFE
ncbi:MAG: maleylacetate reductase [Gammaproteobacteria bacterium]